MATFRSSAPPRWVDAFGDLGQQVERIGALSGPPIMVFQDLDDPAVAITFGEIMCTSDLGAVGLISSGVGRSLEQVRAIGSPIFTNGTICLQGYKHIPQVHGPVRVGGLIVSPDDLLHSDRNGVTIIPIEIASELAEIGHEFVAAETIVLGAICLGTPTPALMPVALAAIAQRVRQLQQRVSHQRKGG